MNTGDSRRLNIRPQFHKLKLKALETGQEELHHESQQSSVFNNVSAIQKIPSSRFSCGEFDNAFKELSGAIAGTEDIGDLIEDENTVLVFKEKTIHTSFEDVEKIRYIVYQKGQSEGIIKIKDSNHTNKIDDEEDEDKPFTFRQCSFYFCDTTSKEGKCPKSYYEGIQVLCSCPVKFIDCAFVGISYHKAGTKTHGVPFKAFIDYGNPISLGFENCYFSGIQTVLFTNLPSKKIKFTQCTIEKMETDALVLTHPHKLVIRDCSFVNCSANIINVKLFEDEQQDKSFKIYRIISMV